MVRGQALREDQTRSPSRVASRGVVVCREQQIGFDAQRARELRMVFAEREPANFERPIEQAQRVVVLAFLREPKPKIRRNGADVRMICPERSGGERVRLAQHGDRLGNAPLVVQHEGQVVHRADDIGVPVAEELLLHAQALRGSWLRAPEVALILQHQADIPQRGRDFFVLGPSRVRSISSDSSYNGWAALLSPVSYSMNAKLFSACARSGCTAPCTARRMSSASRMIANACG